AGVSYQRLQHPDGLAMTQLVDVDLFKAKFFCIAKFSDGSNWCFYDGQPVEQFTRGQVRAAMSDLHGVAVSLAQAFAGDPVYSAVAVGNTVQITGQMSEPFDVSVAAYNGGSVDDQTISAAITTPATGAANEVPATGTVTVTGGSTFLGVNKVTSI